MEPHGTRTGIAARPCDIRHPRPRKLGALLRLIRCDDTQPDDRLRRGCCTAGGGLDALLNRGVRRQAIAAAACASISALAYILWMIHIGWGEVLVRYGFVVTFAFMVPLFALAQFVVAFVCDRVVRMHAGRPERDPGRSLR